MKSKTITEIVRERNPNAISFKEFIAQEEQKLRDIEEERKQRMRQAKKKTS